MTSQQYRVGAMIFGACFGCFVLLLFLILRNYHPSPASEPKRQLARREEKPKEFKRVSREKVKGSLVAEREERDVNDRPREAVSSSEEKPTALDVPTLKLPSRGQRPSSPAPDSSLNRPRGGRPSPTPNPRSDVTGADNVPAAPRKPKNPEPLPPDLERLAAGIRSSKIPERLKALQDAGALGEKAEPIVADVISSTLNPQSRIRTVALEALGAIRPDLHKHILTIVVDEDYRNRQNAISALGRMGESAKPVAPFLITFLKRGFNFEDNGDLQILESAIISLRAIAPDDASAATPLIQLLNHPKSVNVAVDSLRSLIMLGQMSEPVSKRLIPALISCVKNVEHPLRIVAVEALGIFGPDAKEALQILKPLEQDRNKQLRDRAIAAVKKIAEVAEK